MNCSIDRLTVFWSIVKFTFKIMLQNIYNRGRVNKNQGPWIILKDDPGKSVIINWTTKRRTVSSLKWGSLREELCNMECTKKSKIHSVNINNLIPGSKYYYTISEKLQDWHHGNIFSFKTISKESKEDVLKIVVVGDMQPNNGYTIKTGKLIAKQISRENPDCVVQVGDLVHFGNSVKEWINTLGVIPVFASERPLISATGNHEYFPFFKNKKFRKYFPYNFEDKKGSYYSIDIGDVHIAFLDAYDDGFNGMNSKISGRQKVWLEKDLTDAEVNGKNWVFIVLHQPVFTSGEYPDDLELQRWLVPVLSDHDVDMVFYGHAHLYEHWKYKYGENGLIFNKDHKAGKSHIDYFCIGSSGIDLESNYELFGHKPYFCGNRKLYNANSGQYEIIESVHYPWNRKRFCEGKLGTDYFSEPEKHYYHLPFDENKEYSRDSNISYNTMNEMFGYLYGENTMHYAVLDIQQDKCILSVRYADGSLLKGPDGAHPQIFNFHRKNRKGSSSPDSSRGRKWVG